jgi:cold shock CspA family protein/ribosome-associated translation inhibitor RaiA
MQKSLALRWHGVDPSEALASQVIEDVARLERVCDRITGCVVTFEGLGKHHRQSGSQYRVRVELAVPGGKIVVGRDPPKTSAHADLYAAAKGAFRETRRQLEDYVRRREQRVKAHATPPTGRVVRLYPRGGYGFLLTEDGREIYFHEHSVLRGGFSRLKVGSRVRFAEEPGDDGPQASTVRPVGRQPAQSVG